MSGSYSVAIKYSTEDERFQIYGILKREKQFNDFSKIWKYEICIPESRILV